jgi:hypothetical protein
MNSIQICKSGPNLQWIEFEIFEMWPRIFLVIEVEGTKEKLGKFSCGQRSKKSGTSFVNQKSPEK